MLKITSKHLEVTAPIRERVESRLAKLERYDIHLINPHVIISEEKPLFKIEASVKVPQGNYLLKPNTKTCITPSMPWGRNWKSN